MYLQKKYCSFSFLTDVGILVQGNCDQEIFCLLIYVPVSLLLCFFNVKSYFRGFPSHQKALYFGVFGGKMAKIGYIPSAARAVPRIESA